MRLTAVQLAKLTKGQAICASDVAQVVKADGKPTRWRLNSGARMQTRVDGIGQCELVIDLSGVSFEHPSIPMLREHGRRPSVTPDDYYITAIGRWEGVSVDAAGIWGQPIVYTPDPAKPLEADMPSLREGGEVAALMERGHPWQASVKITGDYELIAPGQATQVNGRTELASDDLDAPPLLICRRGVVSETSVCTFGADAQTGAVAASRTTTNPEPTMSKPEDRVAALLKRFPGDKHAARIAVSLSKGHTDEQITAELSEATDADHKAALAAKDEEIAKLKAEAAGNATKFAELQAKLDALIPEKKDDVVPAATKGGSSTNSAPKTYADGVAILKGEGTKLDGFKLRTAVLSRFPNLRVQIQTATIGAPAKK